MDLYKKYESHRLLGELKPLISFKIGVYMLFQTHAVDNLKT